MHRRFKSTVLIFLNCFIIVNIMCSQNKLETARWRFGNNAGLDFPLVGAPVPLALNGFLASTSASISDSLGNLMFYLQDNKVLFNALGDTMMNGELSMNFGLNTPQKGLIVRKSGKQYYVICNSYLNYALPYPYPPMVYYAIVDMNLDGGLGAVTSSNIPISQPGEPLVSKMAITQHCNGKDHWLLCHVGGAPGSNLYKGYLVSSTGISTVAVVSAIGAIQPQGPDLAPGSFVNRQPHKFSPNGRKLAAPMPYRRLELLDFNTNTGQLSNVIVLDTGYQVMGPNPNYVLEPEVRSVEFSADGSKLYVAYSSQSPSLVQFDLSAGSPSSIAMSKTVINLDSLGPHSKYDLQLALDGKIYKIDAQNTQSLSVIHSPNNQGLSCNYTKNSLSFSTVTTQAMPISLIGLPIFESNYFEQKPILSPITGSIICGVVNYSAPVLSAMAGYSVSSYYWNFNDPLSGANTSTLSNPTHTFSANGTYTVKLALNYHPCGTDTLKQVINITGLPVFSVTGKTTICKGESTVLNFSGANAYTLNTTAISQNTAQVQPTLTSVYTVTAKDNSSGCSSLKTLTVTVLPCVGISETSLNESLKVYPNPNSGVFTFETPEAYEIKVYNSLGQEVYRASISAGTSLIDISQEAKGVYLLEWSGKTTKGKVKLVLN